MQVGADTEEADSALDVLDEKIAQLEATAAELTVGVNDDVAVAKLTQLQAYVDQLETMQDQIVINVDAENADFQLGTLVRIADGLQAQLDALQPAAAGAGDALGDAGASAAAAGDGFLTAAEAAEEAAERQERLAAMGPAVSAALGETGASAAEASAGMDDFDSSVAAAIGEVTTLEGVLATLRSELGDAAPGDMFSAVRVSAGQFIALGEEAGDDFAQGVDQGVENAEGSGGGFFSGIFAKIGAAFSEEGDSDGEGFGSAFSGALMPLLIGAIIGALTLISALLPAMAASIGGMAGIALGAYMLIGSSTSQGPLYDSWQKFLKKLEDAFRGAADPMIDPLKKAFTSLGDLVGSLPVKKIFAELATAITPLVNGIEELAKAALPEVVKAFGSVKEAFADTDWSEIGKVIGNIFAAFSNSATLKASVDVFNGLYKALNAMNPGMAAAITDLAEAFDKVNWTSVGQAIGTVAQAFGEIAKVSIAPILDFFSDLINKLGASKLAGIAGEIIAIVAAVKLFSAAMGIADAVMDANPITLVIALLVALGIAIVELIDHWKDVEKAASEVWAAVKTAWTDIGSFVTTVATDVWHAVVTAWDDIVSGVKTAGNDVLNAVKTAWNDVVSAVKTAGNDTLSAARTAWNAVESAVKTAATAVYDAVRTAWNDVVSAGRTAWNDVSSTVHTAWDDIESFVKTAVSDVVSVVTSMPGKVASVGSRIFDDLTSGLKDLGSWIMSNVVDPIVNFITSIPSRIGNVGSRIASDIMGGLESLPGAVLHAIGLAHGGVVGAAVGIGGTSGLTMVGEQGPELVSLPTGSTVHSNPDTQSMLASGAGSGGQVTMTVEGGGSSAFEQFMIMAIRNWVRVKGGGNVQKAFGKPA